MSKQQVKILLLDVEMAPMKGYFWGLFDQNIPTNMVKEWSSMLAWGAMWLHSDEVIYFDQSKQPKSKIRNDKNLLKKLWRLIKQADIVIAHNLPFDKKKSNARMLVNGIRPVKPYKEICTLKIARKHFKMDSNKLAELGRALGCKVKKYEHSKFPGNTLFVECAEGNPEAWKEMRKYNPDDVRLLKEIYLKLIPWDRTINFNVFHDDNENRCSCGSFVVRKEGFYEYKKTTKYQQYSCSTCGKWFHGNVNLISKIKRRDMLK